MRGWRDMFNLYIKWDKKSFEWEIGTFWILVFTFIIIWLINR